MRESHEQVLQRISDQRAENLLNAHITIDALKAELSATKEKLAKAEALIQAARDFDASPDDAEFEPPHPIFMMAQDNDNLNAENAELRKQLEARVGWQLVPIDATNEMIVSAARLDWSYEDVLGNYHNLWHLMTASAPKP